MDAALNDLASMTLTVFDGDFPRDVIASTNLTFSSFAMASDKNSASQYDAKTKRPAGEKTGTLILGEWQPNDRRSGKNSVAVLALIPLSLFWVSRKRAGQKTMLLLMATLLVIPVAQSDAAEETQETITKSVSDLAAENTAEDAIAVLVANANQNRESHDSTVAALINVAKQCDKITQRGWAIVALGEIGGYDVDQQLLSIHADESQSVLVRSWAAASRVSMTKTAAGLIEKAHLIQSFPAIGRPLGMRLVEQLNQEGNVSAESLLETSIKVPQIQQAIAPAIMAKGANELAQVMSTADDQKVRRQAAAYLGSLGQNDSSVATTVIDLYQFDSAATDVTWKGGPLFVPGLSWEKDDARSLAENLVAWHLWCDKNNRSDEQRQIHNNLRSLALSRAAGYKSPRFRDANTVNWLKTIGSAVGKEVIREILTEQNVLDSPKYAAVLKEIP